MHIATNRDVWGHIVKHFRVFLPEDSVEDIRINRRTLRSIGLVSSQLTFVAVSELWRSMATLEPVIYTFNAAPYHNLPAAFEYTNDTCSDYWEITHSSDDPTSDIKSRVLGYLSHVRYLHFMNYPNAKERALWKALMAFDWLNPLCPNLRGITFTAGRMYPSTAYDLVPLLVPSLQKIRFGSATRTQDEEAAFILLRFIKNRNIQISDIAYSGYSSRRIVKQIFQFPTLRSAKVYGTGGYHTFLEASDIQFLRQSTLLTSLDIDLGIFRSDLEVYKWIEALQTLSTLSLQGTAPEINNFLCNGSFGLVHSLSLFLCQPYPSPELTPNILDIISSAFPNIHSLCLENKGNFHMMSADITLSGILMSRKRSMRCLIIHRLPLSLSLSNIIDIVKIWPTLERLSLVPYFGSETYNAGKLLPFISREAPRLTELGLPLNVSSLVTQPLTARTSVCSLRRLELMVDEPLALNLEQNLLLAHNLLTLFPKLYFVMSNQDLGELQMIVKSFQRMLSSVLWRGDHLY